jgi:hypothetical protein
MSIRTYRATDLDNVPYSKAKLARLFVSFFSDDLDHEILLLPKKKTEYSLTAFSEVCEAL